MKINLKKFILAVLVGCVAVGPVSLHALPSYKELFGGSDDLFRGLGLVMLASSCRTLMTVKLNQSLGINRTESLVQLKEAVKLLGWLSILQKVKPDFFYCAVLGGVIASNLLISYENLNCIVPHLFWYGCRNDHGKLVNWLLTGTIPRMLLRYPQNALAEGYLFKGFREAVKHGSLNTAQLLLSNPLWSDVTAINHEPVRCCIAQNDKPMVELLVNCVKQSVQKDAILHDFETLKSVLDEKGLPGQFAPQPNMLKNYLDYCYPEDRVDDFTEKQLLYAIAYDKPDEVIEFEKALREQLLLTDRPKDGDIRHENNTLMHFAAIMNSPKAIKALIKKGYDINSWRGPNGLTPLQLAIQLKHKDAEEALLTSQFIGIKSGLDNRFIDRVNLIDLLAECLDKKDTYCSKEEALADQISYLCKLLKHKHAVKPLENKLSRLTFKQSKPDDMLARKIVSYIAEEDIVKSKNK